MTNTMDHERSPENIAVALVRTYKNFPKLLIDQVWLELESSINPVLQQIIEANNSDDMRNSIVVFLNIISDYPDILALLNEEIHYVHQERIAIESKIKTLLLSMDQSPNNSTSVTNVILQLIEQTPLKYNKQRFITISKGGIDGTISRKLNNLRYKPLHTIEFFAGLVLIGVDIYGLPEPIVVAAGILIAIQGARRMLEIDISEREASVFWGLIKACKKKGYSKIKRIIGKTNKERKKLGLGELTFGEITIALNRLIEIKTIKREGKKWYILENFIIA